MCHMVMHAGLVVVSIPRAATAEGACTNFSTSSTSGIQWCDTKEGSGVSPTKGQLIRCWTLNHTL
jgi:hypothetical protein